MMISVLGILIAVWGTSPRDQAYDAQVQDVIVLQTQLPQRILSMYQTSRSCLGYLDLIELNIEGIYNIIAAEFSTLIEIATSSGGMVRSHVRTLCNINPPPWRETEHRQRCTEFAKIASIMDQITMLAIVHQQLIIGSVGALPYNMSVLQHIEDQITIRTNKLMVYKASFDR